MTPYSQDLRRQILEACAVHGNKRVQVAARFKVSLSFIVKLLQRQRTTGAVAVKPRAGGMPLKLTTTVQKQLAKLAVDHPTLSLRGLQQAFLANEGSKLAQTTIHRALVAQLSSNYQAVRKSMAEAELKEKSCPCTALTPVVVSCERCAGQLLTKKGRRLKANCEDATPQEYPVSTIPPPDDCSPQVPKRERPRVAGTASKFESRLLAKAA